MTRVRLKSLFRGASNATTLLDLLCAQTGEKLCVRDSRDNVLYGDGEAGHKVTRMVSLNGEKLGMVSGGEGLVPVATSLVEALVTKEHEKKEIGEEVLEMYREINLIYNFSEQLADRIEPKTIASLAIEEANKIMQAQSGSVVLWPDRSTAPEVLTSFGTCWKLVTDQGEQKDSLLQLLGHENPEIFNRDALLKMDPAIPDSTEGVLYAPLKAKGAVIGLICLTHDDSKQFTAADLKLLTTIALQSASAIESALMYEKRIQEAKEREETMRQIHAVTSRFVPFEFLRSLGKTSLMETQLGDQAENVVTVVFLDIRKFTTLAENMTPEENFKFVNSFNGRVGPIIKRHNGFVNQYLGDGLMAIFPSDPANALRASIEIQKEIIAYNAYRNTRGRLPIRAGIGIHTGPLIMGITGDDERWDAATISDTVNTASRIENLTKYYKSNIIFSYKTLSLIEDPEDFDIRSLGTVQVKGRLEPIRIFECFDGDIPDAIALKKETLVQFNHGVETFLDNSFREATRAFSQVLVANPDDETAQCFLGRISNLISSELEFDGVQRIVKSEDERWQQG